MAVTEGPRTVAVAPSTHRRRGLVLLAIAVFNVWLWGTRIRNLIASSGEFSAAFVGVHAVLYGTSLLLAGVLAVLGWRMWREGREESAP